ncbi:uncharacterized protein LOC108600307 isoform X2 [Drosophila busckii]|uniref:uncharacterized protein LOC108600307 isoform X2 n=1 Tax=Drosophila busckii TaxID=30019 RepID=UPI00083F1399|nr:uncharacterized protein LOC108600307 isoform X2 [Drosophila busckii]
MCKSEWSYSKHQLKWACVLLNCVIVLGNDYAFNTLFTLLIGLEATVMPSLLVDIIFIVRSLKFMLLATSILNTLLCLALLFAGSMSVIKFTDVYVVTREFRNGILHHYEEQRGCCGIHGPGDYEDLKENNTIPKSCYHNHNITPEHLVERGCLYAATGTWFWFIFSNCYWVAFALIIVNDVYHWKLIKAIDRSELEVE